MVLFRAELLYYTWYDTDYDTILNEIHHPVPLLRWTNKTSIHLLLFLYWLKPFKLTGLKIIKNLKLVPLNNHSITKSQSNQAIDKGMKIKGIQYCAHWIDHLANHRLFGYICRVFKQECVFNFSHEYILYLMSWDWMMIHESRWSSTVKLEGRKKRLRVEAHLWPASFSLPSHLFSLFLLILNSSFIISILFIILASKLVMSKLTLLIIEDKYYMLFFSSPSNS